MHLQVRVGAAAGLRPLLIEFTKLNAEFTKVNAEFTKVNSGVSIRGGGIGVVLVVSWV
jgi:hypothetical protein